MKKKAAIQLSVNFLVIIIISIIVLSMGFVLINRSINSGTESINQLDSQLEAQIERLLADNSAPVAIPIVQRDIPRGGHGQFAIGVLNLDNSKSTTFSVGVYANISIKKGENTKSKFPNDNTVHIISGFDLITDGENKNIPFQQNDKFVVPIQVDKNAPSGLYVFNVCICQNDDNNNACENSCKVSDISNFYSEQLYKLYVKVP